MRTVLYLANQDLLILVASVQGKTVRVIREYYKKAPSGSVLDGKIIDENVFMRFVKLLQTEYDIPMQNVTLVISSASALTRRRELPLLSRRQVLDCLPREFSEVERAKNPVYTYTVLSRHKKSQKILASMVERELLEKYKALAEREGIRLTSIVMSPAANITMLRQIAELQKDVVVVQSLEGNSIINYLFVGGECFYFNNNRILAERETPAFGVECARAINKLQQFLKSEQTCAEITRVFLAGEHETKRSGMVQESMLQMNPALDIQILVDSQNEYTPAELNNGSSFHRFYSLIGALLVPVDRCNLIHQMQYTPEQLRRRRELFCHLSPLLAALLLGIGVSAFQAVMWFKAIDQVNHQHDYLADTRILQTVVEYDRIEAQNQKLDRQIRLTCDTWNHLQSYPLITSKVRHAVTNSVAGMGTAVITDYRAATGTVTIMIRSGEAELINQIIMNLETHSEVFDEISYHGFGYDEREANWQSTVTISLARPLDWEAAQASVREETS